MAYGKFMVHDEKIDIPITTGGSALPSGSAFLVPGVYIVNGVSYDCTRPGLYRWFAASGQFINRIVGKDINGVTDVGAIVSAICWNHCHGRQTEYGLGSSDLQTMSNVGRYRKWSARCGYIAALAAWVLGQYGVTARVKNVVTQQTNNGYDDGHLVLETLDGAAWRMWDMTNGRYFVDANGNHMSVAGFVAQIANGGTFPDHVRLDYDAKYGDDVVTLPNSAIFSFSLYWEMMFEDDAALETWYRRIFQTIL